MEFTNKIEIRGVVGRAELNTYAENRVCKFTVITEYSYHDRDNNPVIESIWFTVNAWEGRNMPDLNLIQKGSWVRVLGRVRNSRFTGQDGVERISWDIQASRVDIIPREDEPMQPQRYL